MELSYNQPAYYQQPPIAYTQPVQSVSILWYAVAILFRLIGAARVAAKNILIVGEISWAVQYFLFLA